MARSKIIVGLEIGTTKTCMVVGEVRPDATATIIGVGEVPSAGIRKGEIIDQSMARQCVCDAWQLAQDHADVDILNVLLSVTGAHIVGENNVGSYRLPDDVEYIDEIHKNNAKEKAEKMEIAAGRFIINRVLGEYLIDGGGRTRHPVGLCGRTLDVACHVIHGVRSRLQSSLLCVRQVPLEVEDIVFAPLATAQMVLSRQQKQATSLLIDIGGGTTDFICYNEGDIVTSGCIPVGGNTINTDITNGKLTGQKITFTAAEFLKCTEGNAWGDQQDRSLAIYKTDTGLHDVSIPRGVLNRIIYERLLDTLELVRERIPAEVLNSPNLCVYLSGGTSLMRGLSDLAGSVFKCPIYQPSPLVEGEKHSYLDDPRFCTAIGLIRHAQIYDDDATEPPKGILARILDFFRGSK